MSKTFSRFIADWSVENIDPGVNPYRMWLDVGVSPKKNKEKNR
jgi:hypothetical protein